MTEKVYKQHGYEVEENPDIALGRMDNDTVDVMLEWVIDREQQTEFVLIQEFPNGGAEYREETIVAEEGHWTATDQDGVEFPYDMDSIPDDWKTASPVTIPVPVARYIPYTQEELAAIERQKAEAEEARKKAQERDAMIDSMPATMSDMDAAICELYEMVIGE